MPFGVEFLVGDTARGPSMSIWGDLNINDVLDDPSRGCYYFEDFMSFPKTLPTTEGNWGDLTAFSSASATVVDGGTLGGAATFAGVGDNEGVSFRSLAAPFRIGRGQKTFAWEIRLKLSTIADTKNGLFVGLRENAALTAIDPITALGVLADRNVVGFHRPEGDGDGIDTVYKADGVTAVVVGADAVVPVADTFVKLGMRYYPSKHKSGDNYTLAFFKDGVELAGKKQLPAAAGTDFPNDVNMGIVVAALNATGTAPGSFTVDWIRAFQAFEQ